MIQATRQNQGSTYRIRLRSACSVANKRLSLEFDARCKGCPGEVAQGSLRFGKDMKKHRDIYMGLFSDFVLVEHAPFGDSMGNSYEFFLGSPWSKSKFQLTSGFAKSLRFSTGRAQLQCSQGYCSSMRGCRWRRSPLGKQWRTWVFLWTAELQGNVAQKASKKGHLIDEHPRRIEKNRSKQIQGLQLA